MSLGESRFLLILYLQKNSLLFRFNFYLRQQNRLTAFVDALNRKLISPGFFLFVVVNYPFNSYGLMMAFLRKRGRSFVKSGDELSLSSISSSSSSSSSVDRLFVVSFIFTQIIAIFAMSALMSTFSSSLHKGKRKIDLLQVVLKRGFLFHKWKFLVLFERLNSEHRIGFSIGALGAVSQKAILEVSFSFFVFLINIIKIKNFILLN